VKRTSWSLDPATRTLRAEIDLPNPGGRLRPGLYAVATLSVDLPDLLTLPRTALVTEGDVTQGYRTWCYQVEGGKLRRLFVETGMSDRERIQALKKLVRPAGTRKAPRWVDFSGREEIVRDGVKDLMEGQEVKVVRKP
jgi:multidrug efflux pump subunit AcrA (membrane-fusion protein)